MKKIIVLIINILILVSSGVIYSDIYSVKTGIIDFHDVEKKSDTSKFVISELTSVLGRYSFISLVERSKLGAIIKELELRQTGLVDPSTAAEIRKVHGLQLLIEGTISKNNISARVIHVETAKIIATAAVIDKNEIEILGNKLASGIEVYLARENLKKLRNDNPEISLEFWIERKDGSVAKKITSSDKDKIKIGTPVSFHYKANKDGYLTIVDIQPNGDVVIIYPNDFSGTNVIKSGIEYSIPSKNDEFEIIASEPSGMDTIVLFFTQKKVDWLDIKKLSGDGFKSVKEGEKFTMSRGFNVTATKLKSNEWKSVVFTIFVEK